MNARKLRTIFTANFFLVALVLCTAPRAAQTPNTISITASRFSYAPNEITVKKGEKVTLLITSADVTHGLVIEALGVSTTDLKKGKTTSVTFVPSITGTFEGKCAHFCGSGHGSMRFTVHVVDSGGAP
jgi:cytochrome c oxidase subunit II